VLTILRNNRANAWAPPEVAEDLVARGLDPARAVALTEGARLKVKDLEAMAFAGYDGSHDAQGRANKFSLLLQAGGTAVFYSGDCHEPPPAMRGRSVDAVFCWPHPDDAKLRGLCQAIPARQFVLMHGDRFEPGDFFCNFDYAKEKARVERLAPGMEVVIPEPIRRLVP
jgi:L-ascorbate metabolism protein UlaG (beta-lactamase superfamily)